VPRGAAHEGWVDERLAEELPGLGLQWTTVAARPGRTPPEIRDRMRELARRFSGAHVVGTRQDDVPWAYRVLWRKLGVDPDVDRTPVERLMLDRLEVGGIPSRGMPNDAVVVATLETGVPIYVFDADAVRGRLGLRPAVAGESIGEGVMPALRTGEVVLADERRPVARLTGRVVSEYAPGERTTAMQVCALAAPAISQMVLDEALWTASGLLEAAGRLELSSEEKQQ
jgi:DNA/RNA-binding domain of Phe-tRNA-synthetase-like protein